jgi:hypothetical protein
MAKTLEPIVCSYCPEDAINETIEGETEGWESTQYGMKCPECRFVREVEEIGATVGLDPLAQISEAKKT